MEKWKWVSESCWIAGLKPSFLIILCLWVCPCICVRAHIYLVYTHICKCQWGSRYLLISKYKCREKPLCIKVILRNGLIQTDRHTAYQFWSTWFSSLQNVWELPLAPILAGEKIRKNNPLNKRWAKYETLSSTDENNIQQLTIHTHHHVVLSSCGLKDKKQEPQRTKSISWSKIEKANCAYTCSKWEDTVL